MRVPLVALPSFRSPTWWVISGEQIPGVSCERLSARSKDPVKEGLKGYVGQAAEVKPEEPIAAARLTRLGLRFRLGCCDVADVAKFGLDLSVLRVRRGSAVPKQSA